MWRWEAQRTVGGISQSVSSSCPSHVASWCTWKPSESGSKPVFRRKSLSTVSFVSFSLVLNPVILQTCADTLSFHILLNLYSFHTRRCSNNSECYVYCYFPVSFSENPSGMRNRFLQKPDFYLLPEIFWSLWCFSGVSTQSSLFTPLLVESFLYLCSLINAFYLPFIWESQVHDERWEVGYPGTLKK